MNIIAHDKRYIWHPYTQHATERDPVFIQSAKGSYLYNEKNEPILDAISSWWTCIHGHSHPKLNRALYKQAQTLQHVMFAGFTHEPAVKLAEVLSKILPGDLNRTFFSDNGSTSIEVALKVAYQYWKNRGENRKKFIAFQGSYHGDTLGAMALGKGCGFFRIYEDLLFSIDTIPYPETWDGDELVLEKERKAFDSFKTLIDSEKDEIAALIIEPLMQGAGGIRFSRSKFIKKITEYVQAQDILVIYDEVAVGFGRTGSLFACHKIQATPDMICLSKGLTSGYLPMSVTVVKDKIFDVFLDNDFKKALIHGHSFTANPLACAVALESLHLFKQENTLEKIKVIEMMHRCFLVELAKKDVVQARVMGSILAFNLIDDDKSYKSKAGEYLRDWFLSRGCNIRPIGNVVYLMPPYCFTKHELEICYDMLLKGLKQL